MGLESTEATECLQLVELEQHDPQGAQGLALGWGQVGRCLVHGGAGQILAGLARKVGDECAHQLQVCLDASELLRGQGCGGQVPGERDGEL